MLRIAIPFVLVSLLAACTTTPKAADVQPEQAIVTAQVAETAYGSGVSAEDAALLKRVAVEATAAKLPLEWANPQTGTNGELVSLSGFQGRHGQQCRSFRTTVATYFGISWFQGEACEVNRGSWTLSWLKKED